MRVHSKHSSHDEAPLRRAVRHPKRLEMLGYLAGAKVETDEIELAETLGLSLPLAKYHLGVLRCADLVVPTEGSGPGTTDRYVVSVAGS